MGGGQADVPAGGDREEEARAVLHLLPYAAANGADDGSGAVPWRCTPRTRRSLERERGSANRRGRRRRFGLISSACRLRRSRTRSTRRARCGGGTSSRGSYSNISRRGTGRITTRWRGASASACFSRGRRSTLHPATMHGAYLSGAREARQGARGGWRRGSARRESSGVSSSVRVSDERNRR